MKGLTVPLGHPITHTCQCVICCDDHQIYEKQVKQICFTVICNLCEKSSITPPGPQKESPHPIRSEK